jgi:hypothetical protein
MATLVTKRRKLLDDEESFNLWMEKGTLHKAEQYMTEQGKINPKTGKPFTWNAIRTSAMRYLIEHPEIGRKYIEKNQGFKYNDEDWNRVIYKTAASIYMKTSSDRFWDWVRRHGFEEREDLLREYVMGKRGTNDFGGLS